MNNKEIAQRVVDRMLDMMNTSNTCLPWVKPWSPNIQKPVVRVHDGVTEMVIPVRFWRRNGSPYQGVNTLLLSLSGKTGEFITGNQAIKEGGKIKKGAKSVPVVYWNMLRKEDPNDIDPDTGKPKVKTIPLLKYYNVFSLDDIEGLKPKHNPDPVVIKFDRWHYEPVEGDPVKLDPAAEAIVASYLSRSGGLRLERDGVSDRAFYSPMEDKVVVPHVEQFKELAEFYSTLFHELGHSTGHSSRLNRLSGPDKIAAWGDENYSKEELVAEITAASILTTLGLESGNSFRNSTAYVQGWAAEIKSDPMKFVSAAGKAEKAIDLILGTSAQPATV